MKCPSCETEGAYVGLTAVECKNRRCFHYKGDLVAEGEFRREPTEKIPGRRRVEHQWAKPVMPSVQMGVHDYRRVDAFESTLLWGVPGWYMDGGGI